MSDHSKEPQDAQPLAIVGLGASAGGITALNNFFDVMTPDTGMAFVVVLHLNPDFDTHLHELLDRHTEMKVVQAESGAKLEADHVYVIPPDAEMLVNNGKLLLQEPEEQHRQDTIDKFFRSLADDCESGCVGVVMSGAGFDGTVGLQAIKQAGGLVLVQDPSTAGYDSMPRSAIRAGVADGVLPVEQIATRLETFARYISRRKAIADDDEEFDQEYVADVCEALGRHVQHDFSQYKRPMLSRRIRRRMMLVGSVSAESYLERVRDSSKEAEALFKDLLISVTAFFRDPEAFEQLEDKLAELVEESETDTLRIWVPGCATGEEAYSIAILAVEVIERMRRPVDVQLFATDIDERALKAARAGLYDAEQVREQVHSRRIERFFVRRNDHYKVVEKVRDMCIFSSHDLVSDPPFSRIDFLSCRNVLIYMEPELQKKLIALFHYALRPGGYLFLGPAEGVRGRDNLFRTVDASKKLFQAKELPGEISPKFPVFDQLAKRRHRGPYTRRKPDLSPRELGRVFQQRLLDRFGPASALVDENGRVMYFSGRLGRFLEHSSGPVEDHIVELARTELRLHLRTALHKARSRHEEVVVHDIRLRLDDRVECVNLIVSPLQTRRNGDPLWMVVFEESTAPPQPLDLADAVGESFDQDELVEQLEAELEATRDHLESTIAQLETANEELKSSNEELLSMNEELQSSNEEMQTSKEELQSVNQELETVNNELNIKVDELDRAHADLKNLFESTRVPTVFLDRQLRIKQFTPAAKEIFRLIEADIGRPLADITLRVTGVDLLEEVEEVLETLAPRELRVERDEKEGPQRSYLLRIHPYRTLDDVIDGAVLTFVDVTELEQTTQRLRTREEQQACIAYLGVEALTSRGVPELIDLLIDGVCDTLTTDACAVFAFQQDGNELILEAGRGWDTEQAGELTLPVGTNSLAGYTLRMEGAVIADDLSSDNRFRPSELAAEQQMSSSLSCVIHGPDGPYGVLAVYARQPGLFSDDDANFLVAAANVITSALGRRKRVEELRANEARMRAMADAVPVLLWLSDPDRRYSWFNRRWLEFTGRDLPQEVDEGWTEGLHPDERDHVIEMHEETFRKREPLKAEFRLRRADGDYRWVALRAQPWYSPEGEYMGSIGACIDITERREFEEALQRADELKDDFLAMLGHELRNPLAAITTAVDLLKMIAGDEPRIAQVRGILERQTGQMKRLLDGLLDVTRIERGKMRLQREVIDLEELVEHVLDDWSSRIDDAGLTLVSELERVPMWITGDRTRLMQVFSNLLSNAVKFTDAPGEVRVDARAEADVAVVSVTDTGAGLSKEAFEQIFEPFQQAEQTIDRSQGGLGMGLPLAKGLVEAHGGTITLHSDGPGEGATFVVSLPLVEPPSQISKPEISAPTNRRILIIEDNRDAADLIATVLEQTGHNVAVCHNGESGLEKAREFGPDVVLCDIGLPGALDGFGVARALREDPAFDQLMLVAMTGYGSENVRDQSRQAGFDTHLVKPVDLETIETVLSLGAKEPAGAS